MKKVVVFIGFLAFIGIVALSYSRVQTRDVLALQRLPAGYGGDVPEPKFPHPPMFTPKIPKG